MTGPRHVGKYGIDRPGHVSDLGRDLGHVATLTVGKTVNQNVSVDVFEVPQSQIGMLGTDWIMRNRVILDYNSNEAIVDATGDYAAQTRNRLMSAGYHAVPMTMDDGDWVVPATINGVTRRMMIASASGLTIDKAFAQDAGIPLLRSGSMGGGPEGTLVANAVAAKPVTITIGDWHSTPLDSVDVEDTYGYSNNPRPANDADANGGLLGGTFLTQSKAVIDFGNSVVYFK